MKKALALLLLIACLVWAGPVWAGDDDDLPQFPKIAPPDPLPDTECKDVAQPLTWGLGDWVSPTLRIHVEKTSWSISGSVAATGTNVVLEECRLNLSNDAESTFAGVRALDGHLYGAFGAANGKIKRLEFTRP